MMPSTRFDGDRDYAFADRALALRQRAALTQRDLGALLDVSAHSIHAWEAGLSYPATERLTRLIAVYAERGALAAGREEEEAAALWEIVRARAPRRTAPFDPTWFAALQRAAAAPVPATALPSAAGVPASWHDGGDRPALPVVQGRAVELSTLDRWVRDERCRVVEVLGVGGIGKTTVAAHLAYELAPVFAVVYWRSLRNALPVDEWLAGAIDALSAGQAVVPAGLDARLGLLLELLRARRALLVLDNLETILEPGAPEVRYRAGDEGYGTVLRRLAEGAHQGCLLLTSREQPLPADDAAVRALRLEGLGVDAGRALLEHRALRGDEAAWGALVARYGGNPLALRVVGETIGGVFGGDIAAFLAQDVAVFGGIRQLLDAQVGRLSALEQAVLTALAVAREPVGFADLVADLGPGVARGDAVEAVEALQRRSLTEWGAGGAFTIQPVVLEYVTARLGETLAREILAAEPTVLVSQALLQATAKDYVRRGQERLIAQPLLERLHGSLGRADVVERRLLDLLEAWRGRPVREQGYGPGNVLNLLRLLRGNLRELDFSRLALRQAYLQGVEAQDASLAGSHLSEAILSESFTYPTAVALSADGMYLAMGTSTGEVSLRRVADRTPLLSLHGHSSMVWGVALSGDRRLLASGSYDGTVKLWDAENGRLRTTLPGHTGGVWGVALSADGQLVASGGEDGTVTLWDAESGRLLAALQGHTNGIQDVALSADGRRLACGGVDGSVRLWEAGSGQPLATLRGHAGVVWGVALSADGRLLASGSFDGAVKLWATESRRLLATLQGHTGAVRSVALSADGQLLASGSQDSTARLWATESGRLLAILQGHSGAVASVAVSGDGRVVASGGEDGSVRLWEAGSGQPLATLRGHAGVVWGVALSADGWLLASGSFDGAVKLWATESRRLLTTLDGGASGVWCVALSVDGRLVAGGGFDGTIRLWDAESGRLLATLQGHSSAIYSVALSGDGLLLASSALDGTVTLWEARSGRLLATLQGRGNALRCVALSRDERMAASGSYDGTVTLWDTHSVLGRGAGPRTLRGERPCERLNITGLTGVTDAQRAVLLALGAVEHAPPLAPPAPVPAPARPPTNILPARTSFVGRTDDVATLRQALDPTTRVGARLLTLSGVAGSGKTRLALAVADMVRDGYRDGVWLVELAPLPTSVAPDPTAVAAATLAALGVQEQPGQDLLDTLVAHLRTRLLLLVLDNCEHVVAACAALSTRLLGACPELRILVTSQLPLGGAEETVWRVAALVAPPRWMVRSRRSWSA